MFRLRERLSGLFGRAYRRVMRPLGRSARFSQMMWWLKWKRPLAQESLKKSLRRTFVPVLFRIVRRIPAGWLSRERSKTTPEVAGPRERRPRGYYVFGDGAPPAQSLPDPGDDSLPTLDQLGGLKAARKQIAALVRNCTDPKRRRREGAARNGILLHGAPGEGKTLLARAIAGEYGLAYCPFSSRQALDPWPDRRETNLRLAFAEAAARRPVLFFLDHLDGLREACRIAAPHPDADPQTTHRHTLGLKRLIDEYRALPGFVLAAAATVPQRLDPELIGEGRFDLKVRVGGRHKGESRRNAIPRPTREGAGKPDLDPFVEQVGIHLTTLAEGGEISVAHPELPSDAADLPDFHPVRWPDMVFDADVAEKLKALIRLLHNGYWSAPFHVPLPSGLLLAGPRGTGKGEISRLLATETDRTYLRITPYEFLKGTVEESAETLRKRFGEIRNMAPSILFFDGLDQFLMDIPTPAATISGRQLLELVLIEIDRLPAPDRVFLVGATEEIETLDPRLLRGGRFSQTIAIPLPDLGVRARLFKRFLGAIPLGDGASPHTFAALSERCSPADIERICRSARREALGRGSGVEPDQPVPTFCRLTLRDVITQIKDIRGPLFPTASSGSVPSSLPSDTLPVI